MLIVYQGVVRNPLHAPIQRPAIHLIPTADAELQNYFEDAVEAGSDKSQKSVPLVSRKENARPRAPSVKKKQLMEASAEAAKRRK